MTEAIHAEQVRLLYNSTKWSVLATIINAVLLTVVIQPVIEQHIAVIWLACLLVITTGRIALTIAYFKYHQLKANTTQWERLFNTGVLLAAINWGSAAIFLFPAESTHHQVFIAFVLGGMAAGAVTTLAYRRMSALIYLIISLAPLILRFFQIDSTLSVAMELMLVLYLVMLITAAMQTHNNNRTTIQLYLESTEREAALARSENRFKTLLQHINDAYFLFDVEGHIHDCNQQASDSIQYNPIDISRLSYFDIVQGLDRFSLEQMWPSLKQNNKYQLALAHRRKDGSTFPVELHLSGISIDDKELVFALAHDITELQSSMEKSEYVSA